MPLGDRDPNASGRNSRASVMSAGSRGFSKRPNSGAAGRNDMNPAVLSMLRTSTELGNVGGLALEASSAMPNVPRASRRSGANSRMSTASSHSATSRRDSRRISQHAAWPSQSSTAGRPPSMGRDCNLPEYLPDTLSPTILNLPGSSPLIPRSRSSRDGGRSRSMTHAVQPNFGLSSNRSYASLRAPTPLQRPRSPYEGYPQYLRRPRGYRPGSPAMSDYTDAQPRRVLGNPQLQRARVPSDVSVRREYRGPMAPHPLRSRSPVFTVIPHADIPPVPPIPASHLPVRAGQIRRDHTSANGSACSGSTNQRTDSDAPSSSDPPFPPTPLSNASTEALVTSVAQPLTEQGRAIVKGGVTPTTLYYDYSEEHFEALEFIEDEADTAPAESRFYIRTIEEERSPVPTPHKVDVPSAQEEMDTANGGGNVIELPASPIPRRITRDLVLAALDAGSTTETNDTSTTSVASRKICQRAVEEQEGAVACTISKTDNTPTELVAAEGNQSHRYSTFSQTVISVIDSSTIEFGVHCSNALAGQTPTKTGCDTTEDGMSDLLEGYQHTESKGESEIEEKGCVADDMGDQRRSHTPKSSDEQSFKSCSGLMEQPRGESDAKSFKTAEDTLTPDKAVSMPASSLPSSKLSTSGGRLQRPATDILTSSPLTILRRPLVPPRDSSFSKFNSRLRASSMISSRHESIVASLSSSADSVSQHQPSVPPRESSSSKEALNTKGVADFLLRFSRTNRLSSRASSSIGRKVTKTEVAEGSEDSPSVVRQVSREQIIVVSQAPTHEQEPPVVTDTPPKSSTNPDARLEKRAPAGISSSSSTSVKKNTPVDKQDLRPSTLPHHHSKSTPSPVIAAPSSAYSTRYISSSYKSPVLSSPARSSRSPDREHRESQTTTHLEWPGQRSSNTHVSHASEPRLALRNSQDESTTDLRLSSYRPMHYLPDLKEESHEDSSLNTSASNLKNSNFRFPHGNRRSLRCSVEEAAAYRRTPSARSILRNSLAQTRGLPSMHFSRMNLIGSFDDWMDLRSHESDGDSPPRNRMGTPSPRGQIRDKYKSVFAGLEASDRGSYATQSIVGLPGLRHPYSPQEVIAEVDNVSIPSVGGLTQRLSEFLPTLRPGQLYEGRGDFPEEEAIMVHAIEELRIVGAPSVKRSSARLRPMPGSPTMLVVEDDVYREITGSEEEGASSGRVEMGAGTRSSDGAKCRSANCAHLRGQTPLAELEAPLPALLRTRSLSLGQPDLRPSLESRLSTTRRSLQTVPSTPTATATETRPWNSDKNYPWATAIPPVDITLPAPTLLRDSPRPAPSRLRQRLSESSEASPISPGTTASPTTARAKRQSRRVSIVNNNSSKVSVERPLSGYDTSAYPVVSSATHGIDKSHEVGDRYPTTSLIPPSNTDTNDLRGIDADSLVRRLSKLSRRHRLRPRREKILSSTVSSRSRYQESGGCKEPNSSHVAGYQSEEPNSDKNARRNTFYNATGMSATKYHKVKMLQMVKDFFGKLFTKKRSKAKDTKVKDTEAKDTEAKDTKVKAKKSKVKNKRDSHVSDEGSEENYREVPFWNEDGSVRTRATMEGRWHYYN
ncbi:hypothetical protein K491DRAFT_711579 [Lophiostoma macrostomum CBS 122681]|uniref:Uncharacterized protein n=1 Tax=Lophiostoma macrostomum CBS 122681 TaxID=1314788 RepID=A0A6A6TKU9_9PLEO|nr:hypothetical protein K491DRAFT_711579 [Lophiostoma macrostomum CBS 122681]